MGVYPRALRLSVVFNLFKFGINDIVSAGVRARCITTHVAGAVVLVSARQVCRSSDRRSYLVSMTSLSSPLILTQIGLADSISPRSAASTLSPRSLRDFSVARTRLSALFRASTSSWNLWSSSACASHRPALDHRHRVRTTNDDGLLLPVALSFAETFDAVRIDVLVTSICASSGPAGCRHRRPVTLLALHSSQHVVTAF